jgi:hypothetical protein
MPEIRRTATEAGIMADASNARTADALATIELVLGEIGERLIALQQAFMTGDQVFRAAGVDGAMMWVQYDSDYIDGAFDFKVVGGSTMPNNESFRRQSALQLMDSLAPFLGSGIINEPELVRHVIEEGFGVKDAQRFLAPPPPPMAPPAVDPITGQPIQDQSMQGQMGGMPPQMALPPGPSPVPI